jgi:hypothetical protein
MAILTDMRGDVHSYAASLIDHTTWGLLKVNGEPIILGESDGDDGELGLVEVKIEKQS